MTSLLIPNFLEPNLKIISFQFKFPNMYCFFIGRNSDLDCNALTLQKRLKLGFFLNKKGPFSFYNGKKSSVYNNMNHLVCIMNTLEHGRHLCCQNLTLKVSGFVVAKFQMFLNFANQRLSIFVSNTVAFGGENGEKRV